MRELKIQGGNWVFHFDRPVYARVVCTVSAFPTAGQADEVTEFISDQPSKEITLYFMAAPQPLGEQPTPDKVSLRAMKLKLSDCAETDGTRIIWYQDKFSLHPWVEQKGQRGEYAPCLPLHPELNKEYVLHDYFREGDPYEAKATICFLENRGDISKIESFNRNGTRTWKSADEGK